MRDFVNRRRLAGMKKARTSRHPAVRAVGYGLVGLVMAGLAITVIAAAVSNHSFYGTNYWGLPLGTYSSLAVLMVVAAVGLIGAIRLVRREVRRRSGR